MTQQEEIKKEKVKNVRFFFSLILGVYAVAMVLTVIVWHCCSSTAQTAKPLVSSPPTISKLNSTSTPPPDNTQHTSKSPSRWFYFGIGIGSIFVFIAFYYYYENFLTPAVQEIENETLTETLSIKIRLLEWIIPAIAIQFFIVVGFGLTVSKVPFADSLYTHPYLYGLQYKRLEGIVQPVIKKAGLDSNDLDSISLNPDEEKETALFLRHTFGEYIKNCPDLISIQKTDNTSKDQQKNVEVIAETNKSATETASQATPQTLTDAAVIREIISCIYKIPYYIAFTFGFLGTLMYTLNDTRHRFFISDLYPKTYVGYLIRFLFVPALCMVIAYFFMNDWVTNLAPALFFMIGFFPQLALQFLEAKTRKVLSLEKKDTKEIPLGLLQGMTDYVVYRFKELGIGDVQNLAYADLNYMRKNWSNDRLLCDFVAQALLLIHFPDDFVSLQSRGIRNIITFKNMVTKDLLKQSGDKYGVSLEHLTGILELIAADPLKSRIETLEKVIEIFENQEMKNITNAIIQASPVKSGT